jgi:acetyltransferase-like isoleucine patch superfamily enzyme
MSQSFDLSGWFFSNLLALRIVVNTRLFNQIIQFWLKIKGVEMGRKLKFNGYPVVSRAFGSRIILGNHCMFNSSRKSVVLDLKRRCNFVTIKEGAEIVIGAHTGISGGAIAAATSVRIGDHVMIGANCTIIDNDFHETDPKDRRETASFSSKPVVIEDNVFLGFNCIVLKGVTIGRNSVIGANSVVVSNIPANSLAMGNPCKLLMKRNWEGSENEKEDSAVS